MGQDNALYRLINTQSGLIALRSAKVFSRNTLS